MATDKTQSQQPWQGFHGPNLGYVQELYEEYLKDPNSVEPDLKNLFDQWGQPPSEVSDDEAQPTQVTDNVDQIGNLANVIAAVKLADKIRAYGHLGAQIYPLGREKDDDLSMLDPAKYQLTDVSLKAIPAKVVWHNAPDHLQNGLEAINELRRIYTKSLAYEFSHVHNVDERQWLNEMVESGSFHLNLTDEERVELLNELTEVEGLEKFLHRTFVGQKRFSIEGVDLLVPMLNKMIKKCVHDGTHNVMIGMAHRGRLNVLAHVLGKPYEMILSEFHHSPNKELVPSEGSRGINYGWTGDVKYHLGADRDIEENEAHAHVTLANNPSHLEFVNPVVEGYARATQDNRQAAGYPVQDTSESLPILIHGDSAFPGEGIVSETLNLSQLPGYQTGGTIHIIANNMIGFTTESRDSRSTKYASDLAKGFEIPIVHVNADDPEACLDAVILAYEYRKRFKKDFLIDLIGYRRFGHNEMDDPAATQPLLYEKINNHPTVRLLYAETLKSEGKITDDDIKQLENKIQERLQSIYDEIKNQSGEIEEKDLPQKIACALPEIKTAVSHDTLYEINQQLLNWPEGFTVYPKLARILKRRANALDENGKVDWALAEELAFATILKDGHPIRFTGQDTERGTFAHRHLVLHDSKSGETFSPLHRLPDVNASFAIHNSPLSEASVLGFEYGYNVIAPETLTIWEAQFGDFANAGQVIFDQFIAAGRAKWGQKSGLVMLLPHGYEGQGPEHSSGRWERFLQLAAENNWFVANLSSAAQYFHILRRQAELLDKDEVRPLVIMTPKSLLRHSLAASPGKELSEGRFRTVVEQQGLGEKQDQVERLILCSGKVAIDLASELTSLENKDWLHIVRVEQLYPFPKEEIKQIMARYNHLKEVVWVQEEPKNMGAWTFVEPRLRDIAPDHASVSYIGRPDRSSPAVGEPDIHKKEQNRILTKALKLEK
ncbi:2-oxoglutarate dehydrogenase E1 component [Scopulibacillus daqui]|uniref:2-oxoglutarate dehydrogenase E1 component n=1 Tax=Scopulibacillus daqui TaxID=1469162 RepID=A0ABS2Q341_9BACL|nr:2-oxoglutarate dehydrogenase E1 component [Scopulibacillus daqui]MBM7646712.1 2-oxoglutarate dehydrogenase E1 component [Scopulibacillus daqui]